MSLFKKEGAAFDAGDIVTETVVGAEAYFQGAMTVRGSIRIEGKVEGDVLEAQTVVIGSTGRVSGNVCAENVVVSGHVTGDIVASGALEITSSGKVSGNVRTSKLVIQDGAVFDGACAMTGDRGSARERVAEHAKA